LITVFFIVSFGPSTHLIGRDESFIGFAFLVVGGTHCSDCAAEKAIAEVSWREASGTRFYQS
jgi:hypothetical protein